jgi:hypothetical protein
MVMVGGCDRLSGGRYTFGVQANPMRDRFESERRRAAFLTFLPAAGIGIIASDTWVAPWAGVPGGLLIGAVAYGLVWSYETIMWRRHHGQ